MIVYHENAERFKQYKTLKKKFATTYDTPERVVQRAIDQLCEYILQTSTGTITTDEFLKLAEPEDSIFHVIIDWSQKKKTRIEQADEILKSLNFVFTTNNKLYKIERI